MADGPKSYQGIMLSSTFTDLVGHRKAAIEAIHHFGYHANVMEYGGASAGADVIGKSLQMVADSVAYVLIIGHRYGQSPVDPKRNPEERSITELEFDQAIRRNLPILLFVITDDHPVTKATGGWETDPAKTAKLEAFIARAKLQDPQDSASTVARVWESFESEENFARRIGIAIGKLALELKIAEIQARPETEAVFRGAVARLDHLTIPENAVYGAIARFMDVRPDAAEDEVAQAVETFETGYRALQEQVAAIAIVDNRIASLKADAEQALHDGDLETARRLYGEAATAAREKLTEPVHATAQLLEAEASAHLLALDWEAADKVWADATAMLVPFDRSAGETIAGKAASALEVHGERFARGGALRASINRWRSLAESAAARGNIDRAADCQNNIGNVLVTLGKSAGGEAGLTLLAEAVTAYRTALTVHTEAAAPAQWAMTQSNLGNVLREQGERTGGEAGMALLADAVSAYRAALTVRTEAAMPVQWAMTHNNLGNALKVQGERTDGEDGLVLLADAVAAYRAALTVRTETAMPVQWAMTHNNLGNALQRQGERTEGEAGLALLAEAVAAYRAALTVRTEAAMPANWAMTQNNLAIALKVQGARTGGEAGLALLAEAVAAYRAALAIYTEGATPANWAMTQENLALAYDAIADLGSDTPKNLGMAEAALCDALRIYTPQHMPYYHEKATKSLTRVRKKLAALDS